MFGIALKQQALILFRAQTMCPKDRRLLQSLQTKNVIKDAFLEILSVLAFHQIRISQICEKAHITRTTYTDTYAVVDDILNDVMNLTELKAEEVEANLRALEPIVRGNDPKVLQDNEMLLPACHRYIRDPKFRLIMNEEVLASKIVSAIYERQKTVVGEVIARLTGLSEEDAQRLFWFIVNGTFAVNKAYLCDRHREEYYYTQLLMLKFIFGGYQLLGMSPATDAQ